MIKEQYKINGMSCAACANSSQRLLSRMKGVETVQVNFANKSAIIEYDNTLVQFEQMKTKLSKLGFALLEDTDAVRLAQEKKAIRRFKTLKTKLIVGSILSIPLIVIAMFFPKIIGANYIMFGLTLPIIFWIGAEFYQKAWQQFKVGYSNMDTLVALGTGTAFSFSVLNTFYPEWLIHQGLTPHVYYETAGVLIVLILLGRYLEERAKQATSTAIQALLQLQVKEVTILEEGEQQLIPIDQVRLQDIILVKPGDAIPLDGKVVNGDSTIDESMLTGEALPVFRKKGDTVFSGTINQTGILEVKTTKVGSDTLLAQIIKQVQHAQNTKAPVQKMADSIASIFVPAVILIALLSSMTWYLIGPEPQLTHAIITLVNVLIIACPCALGLATPTAIMVGVGKAAKQGILIKNAQSLELADKIDTIVFDKTGTLTEGKTKVQNIVYTSFGASLKGLKSKVIALEKLSNHPLAKAIVDCFEKEIERKNIEVEHFENIGGKGIRARIDGEEWLIGNVKLMDSCQIDISERKLDIKAFQALGNSIVLVATQGKLAVVLGVADSIKPNAKKALKSLNNQGIACYLATGDTKESADKIASQFNLSMVKANLLPKDKIQFIQSLQQEGKVVAMVGDGINDAPALAQADVSIAMGTGTNAAIESAEITLLKGDLERIEQAIDLSKLTQKTIRQNLFWAFIYNIIGIPIAAGALYPVFGFILNPMVAGAAMAFSSVSVVLNSLRLK